MLLYDLLLNGWTSLLEYLSAHVLLCLIPAFFVSGAFNALIPDKAIFNFMGDNTSKARKAIAYAFAALSGLILEVCSCTILPLFAGVWKKGAGFGPAITFLFAGPGITLLSTPLTASVFGGEFAITKLVLSIIISILIGVIMELIFERKQVKRKFEQEIIEEEKSNRSTLESGLFFASLILIMIFGTAPMNSLLKIILVITSTFVNFIFAMHYYTNNERRRWLKESIKFMKTIFPILLVGVFISGAVTPLIPESFIAKVAGQNTLFANFMAVLFGTIAYFPTLVEVPIAQSLADLGMHSGPLMAYLIADPAVSIQTLLVVNKIIKPRRTITYTLLLILFSVLAGLIYGMF